MTLEIVKEKLALPVDKFYYVDVVIKEGDEEAQIVHYGVLALTKRAACAKVMTNLKPFDALHLIGVNCIKEATNIEG
jgi:hypothetical protein